MERKFNKQPKVKIKKGDTVKIIAGNYRSTADKVNTGKVLEVLLDKNRVVVEGINMVTKHQKPSAGKPEGGIKRPKQPSTSATSCWWILPAERPRVWDASLTKKESFSATQRKQESSSSKLYSHGNAQTQREV